MKAAVLDALHKPLQVRNVPDPACPPDGVIVKTLVEGICRCDWHFWCGDLSWMGIKLPLPHVLGHEFCGVVEEIGPKVTTFKKGDRVLVPFSQGDGTCAYCRTGHSNLCSALSIPGVTSWGGYGEYVAIPRADPNLVRMPDGLTDLDGAALGCRFMTAYHGIVDRAQVRPGEWVAVHGCGGAGLAAVQIAAAIGANVIAVDLDERKLDLAKRVGAAQTVNAKAGDPLPAIQDVTGGGAHVAVDALGIAATSRNAICSLRKQGRALQLGFTGQAEQGEIAMPIDRIVLMELQLIGTLGMPTAAYPGLVQMVQAGKLDPKALITRTVPLQGASAILEEMTTFQTVGAAVIQY
jgi:D-arabinose 1-dehydrogenase-like Zn-dependent alcohol dehydrogenase